MSRAKTALRRAKTTGDPDQVTAARDRLANARAAHQDAKNATTTRVTADQCGDVTDHSEPTTKDTTMGHQDQPRRTGFTIHNTNIVTGNARVGSQHDVTGIGPDLNADQVADVIADAHAKVQRAMDKVKRATTTRDTADQHGDVTDHSEPTTKDTTMGHQDQPRRTGFTIHNTNIVTGNARVGSQHDVTGIGPDLNADQVADVIADAHAKVQRAMDKVKRATDQGTSRSNTNVASGDDVVAQQVGFRFGR